MPLLELKVASPEPDLSVRRFAIREGINALYSVGVVFRTKSPALDLERIVGKPAALRVVSGYQHARLGGERVWTGICDRVELAQVEAAGLSTYSLSIVPHLWLLTQKNDYRIFQHQSIPDIIDEVLERGLLRHDPVGLAAQGVPDVAEVRDLARAELGAVQARRGKSGLLEFAHEDFTETGIRLPGDDPTGEIP